MRRNVFWMIVSFVLLGVAANGCKNALLSGGILHFDQKRYDRSREVLLQATAQEPDNAEAWLWLGKAYAELDSTDKARAAFDKAASLEGPKYPNEKQAVDNALEHYWSVRHNDGLQYAKAAQDARATDKPEEAKKDFRLALNQFKKARVYEPNKEETPRNMGVCYFNLGQVDSGLVLLQESRRLAPDNEASAKLLCDQYRRLGDEAAEKGDKGGLQDAVKFYTAAKELCAEDPDLYFSLGVVLYQLAEADSTNKTADYEQAAEAFEKTLSIKPDDQEALYNAASLYKELGQCEKGLQRAQALLDLDPKKGKYHDLRGRLYDCLGNKNERVSGMIFARALSGSDQVPVADFRAHLEKLGSSASDMLKKYREEGAPEEVHTFSVGGATYEAWFYWSRGRGYAFTNGALKYQTEFKPIKA